MGKIQETSKKQNPLRASAALCVSAARKPLVLLLAAAAAARLYMVANTAVIAVDGVEYIRVAKQYGSFNFGEALGNYFPPVYPALIAIYHLPGFTWELAGQLVSFTAGVLTLLPLYFLVRGVYSRPAAGSGTSGAESRAPGSAGPGVRLALVAGLFFAFLPDLVRHSGQVRSEACYILFAMCAIYFAWQGITFGRGRHFALFGLFTSFAYLTRPEGIGLLVVVFAWVLLGFPRQGRMPWRRRIRVIAFALLPAAIIAGSYIAHISAICGPHGEPPGLRLTLKGSPLSVLHGEWIGEEYRREIELLPAVSLPGWLRNWGENVGRLLLRNLHLLLLPLLALALVRRKENPRDGPFEVFVISTVLFFTAVFALMRISYRLPAQLVTPLLVLPALGYFELAGIVKEKFRLSGRSLRRFRAAVLVVIAAVMCAELVPPERIKRLGVRLCGEWVRQNHAGEKPRIATRLARVIYYAQGTCIEPPVLFLGKDRMFIDRPGIEKLITGRGADYLAFDARNLSHEDREYLNSVGGLKFLGIFQSSAAGSQPVTLYEIERSAPQENSQPPVREGR